MTTSAERSRARGRDARRTRSTPPDPESVPDVHSSPRYGPSGGARLLARAAGLLGQIAEEQRRPLGMDMYEVIDRNALYEPPA